MFAVLESCVKSRCLLSPISLTRVPGCLQYEPVRNYPKKPRWIPIAKSKLYKNIVRDAPPKLEYEECSNMESNFELYNRSLWAFERTIFQERELQLAQEARQISEEVEVERMLKLNEAENKRIRMIREEALIEEHEQVKQEILQMKQQEEEKELKKLEEAERQLKNTMERLKGAIPVEQLDDAIAKAMAVEHDYNFAVAKDGRFMVGRENATEVVEGPPPDKPLVKTSEAIVS